MIDSPFSLVFFQHGEDQVLLAHPVAPSMPFATANLDQLGDVVLF